MLLYAVIVVQMYLMFDEVRSMYVYNDGTSNSMHTLLTNAIGAISTLLTAVFKVRLRHIQHSLSRLERSLQAKGDGGECVGVVTSGHWSIEYRTRVWLALAVVLFGYLKYGMLMEDGRKDVSASVVVALLNTISIAGNYYVTLLFVDHVFFAKR
ncbi:Gustatory receptor [Aphis craccivora]|uniref:Gustatory receptor n=1 Tax=Aphis craccivora TaxID=307492 RepID=A0A6G0ZJ68_APHCR|nr:Gustatory receptor [Aphis craccivora]